MTTDDAVESIRSLVLVDPADQAQINKIAEAYWTHRRKDETRASALTNAFRDLTKPMPEEPTDPGVRVVDRDGEEWARRRDGRWACLTSIALGSGATTWAQLVTNGSPVQVVTS